MHQPGILPALWSVANRAQGLVEFGNTSPPTLPELPQVQALRQTAWGPDSSTAFNCLRDLGNAPSPSEPRTPQL